MLLREVRIADGDAKPVDVRISDGRIAEIVPHGAVADEASILDGGGRRVAPAFVEPHLHLDKALLGVPPGVGGLADAIAATARRKAGFTIGDVLDRARRVLTMAIRAGTTAIRAQTEIDPGVGMIGMDAIGALAEEHRSWLRLQPVAFPQEGILCRPGTLPLLRDALARPDSVVGGCPYVEHNVVDARRHVDIVLDLAVEFGALADLHLDLADDDADPRFALADYVARATVSRGLQGRVAIGHATSLGALPPDRRRPVLAALAEADVAVVVLPATDLHLTGRHDVADVRRGIAPLAALRAAGVRVAISSNNIRNAFTPSGTADPLDMALLAGRLGHAASEEDFAGLLDAVTVAGSRILDPDAPAGWEQGAQADIVIFDGADSSSPVITRPDRQMVLSRGNVVFRRDVREELPAGLSGSH